MIQIEFKKTILDNGLTVILHQDKTTPIAAVNVLYKVGSKNEKENKTGFAHLFEHLMFEGSINIKNYDEVLERVGGENNAFTNNDFTNYYLTLPVENLETALWLESDRMIALDFSEEKLNIQKKVVIEEFKQRYLNQPYGEVWHLLYPLAYEVHPYKWPTIGMNFSHIENATLKEVKDFFFHYYSPSNAILSIAGNFDYDKTLKLVEKYFANIPKRNNIKEKIPQEPIQKKLKIKEVYKDVPYDAIYIAFHTVERNNNKYYATDLLSDILSRGYSSRFYTELLINKALFIELQSYLTASIDPGLLIIEGKLKDGVSMEIAEKAIFKELEKIKKNIDDKELKKVKNKTLTSLEFEKLDILNKAMELAYYEFLDDASLINLESDRYLKVKKKDITDLANNIFRFENCSILRFFKRV